MLLNEDNEIQDLCKQITKLSTHDGELDVTEQDRRLGMLFTDRCLDMIKFKIKPDKPPILKSFELLSKDKKFLYEKENPGWRYLPTVSDYTNACSSADAENDSNVYWLKHWMKLVDDKRKTKLSMKLLEFTINMPSRPVPTETSTLYEEAPREVQKIKDIFDGNEIKGGWEAHTRKGMPR